MQQIYADSIAKAKSLYEGFDDVIHDVSHSERVAENAKKIAKDIGYDDFDMLEVCAYWHDTARTKGIDPHEEAGAVMARDDLLDRGASADIANKVYEGIRFHKSTDNPKAIEGKIIRDADKLDIYSVIRWQKCEEAGWTKVYSDDLRKTMANVGRYPDVFTYDLTKDLFKERLPLCLRYWKSVESHLLA